MAIIQCKNCAKNISSKAKECPHCGFIYKENFDKTQGINIPISTKKIINTISKVKFNNTEFVNSTKAIFNDLNEIDFKNEIIPIDESNLKVLINDFAFWAALFMGIVPFLIATTQNNNFQQSAFAIFFATIWGVIFKKFIINDHSSWALPVISFFFTGTIGIPILLFIYKFLPSIYTELPHSENLLFQLLGYVFQVGLCEELLKIAPVFIYIYWKKNNNEDVEPLKIVILGLFSALGFAAFENIMYSLKFIENSAILAINYGVQGALEGTHQAMIISIARYLSTVFGHALYSGIFSYFIALTYISGERKYALFIVGLSLSSLIHGSYDWLTSLQPTFAGFIDVGAFILFYGYVLKLRGMIDLSNIQNKN